MLDLAPGPARQRQLQHRRRGARASFKGPVLSASAAASRLGVSNKTLRVYEQRGLVIPDRTAAGYRAYGSEQMARAAKSSHFARWGSASRRSRVLEGNAESLRQALASHEKTLEGELRKLVSTLNQVRRVRAGAPPPDAGVAFNLPWPWGGERFELREIRPITYIVGPLGSGKTRLAQRLAGVDSQCRIRGAGPIEHGRCRSADCAARRPGSGRPLGVGGRHGGAGARSTHAGSADLQAATTSSSAGRAPLFTHDALVIDSGPAGRRPGRSDSVLSGESQPAGASRAVSGCAGFRGSGAVSGVAGSSGRERQVSRPFGAGQPLLDENRIRRSSLPERRGPDQGFAHVFVVCVLRAVGVFAERLLELSQIVAAESGTDSQPDPAATVTARTASCSRANRCSPSPNRRVPCHRYRRSAT